MSDVNIISEIILAKKKEKKKRVYIDQTKLKVTKTSLSDKQLHSKTQYASTDIYNPPYEEL